MNDTNETLPLAAIETSQLSSITGGTTRCRPQLPTLRGHRGPCNPWNPWGVPQPRPTPCEGPRPGYGYGSGFGFGGGRYYSRSR